MRKQFYAVSLSFLFVAASAVAQNTFPASGNVGIGTTAPGAPLQITSSAWAKMKIQTSGVNAFGRLGFDTNGINITTNASWNGSAWTNDDSTVSSFAIIQHLGDNQLEFRVSPAASSITWSTAMVVQASGKVGIGTSSPAYPLDVSGTVHSSTGYIFPDGTTQTTAFIPANCGADYAESVGVSGDRSDYGPGDILVIDPAAPGRFLKSNQRYSSLVAGIYSTQPGFVGRLHPEDSNSKATEVPMAMVGRVPTKVSAENGPINVGDLLVSSSSLGYAMKGTDRAQMLGAVLGKALGSLDSGTGVIEVLVTLQ